MKNVKNRRRLDEMVVKDKPERQYNGEIFKTSDATPSDDLLDKYDEDGSLNPENFVNYKVEYYSIKKNAIDIALEMVKLQDAATVNDILKTSAILLDFIVSGQAGADSGNE